MLIRGKATVRTLSAAVIMLAALGGVLVLGQPASAAACSLDVGVNDDLDGDGHADAVVGMPAHDGGDGAVDVHYTNLPSSVLLGRDVGGSDAGAGFGSALATADLDQNGCWDLVIGARGDGSVHILLGSPAGLDPASAITVKPPAGTGSDDFGDSLAVAYRSALEPGQDGSALAHDLFVGAPGTTVGGRPEAGAVWRFTISPTGTEGLTVGTGSQVTQDSPGVPGAAEKGDRFGEEVVPDWGGGIVTSAPMEDVGAAANAGGIWRVRGTVPAGIWTTAESFSQNSPVVPGAAETGDHFGSALSSRGGYLVAGIPDENAGQKRDSGAVQVFTKRYQDGDYVPGRMIHQDTRGVSGTVEAGDRFGASVAAGFGISCREYDEIVIGAPGEDVGTRADAGTVTLTPRPATDGRSCPSLLLRQGSGLNGSAEAGDRVGASLGLALGVTDTGFGDRIRLLVGAPGEDVGAYPDAGLLLKAKPYDEDDGEFLVDGQRRPGLTFSGGQSGGEQYGLVLPTSTFD